MRRALWVVLFWVLAVQDASSQSAAARLFAEANQLYRQASYEAARGKYLEVVSAAYVDHRLFYNLGNACFKSDRLGEAILWYERARLLSPRDEDIRANLRFASHVRRDRDPVAPDSAIWLFLTRLHLLPSMNEISVAFSLLLLAVCGMAAWRLLYRERAGTLWLVLFLACASLTILTGIFSGIRMHQLESRSDAIVTAGEAVARSAPDANVTAVFVVHEGTKVRVHRREGNWLLIRLGEFGGWMLSEEVAVI